MDTYYWDDLVTYHWDVNGCLIWDLFETLGRRTDETSLLRHFETSMGVSFGTYLRRRWDVQRDVVTTSPQRLNAGWVQKKKLIGAPCEAVWKCLLKSMCNWKRWYLLSAGGWWSSYVATIIKQTGHNKPSSKLKLFKKQSHQKFRSWIICKNKKIKCNFFLKNNQKILQENGIITLPNSSY